MPTTIRFPFNRNTANHAAELNQIITILPSTATILAGGEATYTSIQPWKLNGSADEAPYTCIVLEFTATVATTIGDGTTQAIGLYGQVNLNAAGTPANQRRRHLLGIVGVNLGETFPQIPIIAQASAELVGYAHITADIAAYDALSIGGVFGNVVIGDGASLTVVARPIRARDYLG